MLTSTTTTSYKLLRVVRYYDCSAETNITPAFRLIPIIIRLNRSRAGQGRRRANLHKVGPCYIGQRCGLKPMRLPVLIQYDTTLYYDR